MRITSYKVPIALLFFSILLPMSSALADVAATVVALRPPAWLADQGAWVPARAGMAVNASDRIRTGPGGRVLLQLAEGSELRIGADTSFVLLRLDPPVEDRDFFSGLLEMARGALRYTTTSLSKSHRRRIDIRVASVNAGISGTDVWINAAPDRDIICLLEGRVTVAHGNDEPTLLDQPMSFYVAPRDGSEKSVAAVTPEQVKKWVAFVALQTGTGVITDGSWNVALASFRSRDKADEAVIAFYDVGVPVEIMTVAATDTIWHRLVVSGFADVIEAGAFAERAGDLLGITDAWIYGP